jgi:hypothetical protein
VDRLHDGLESDGVEFWVKVPHDLTRCGRVKSDWSPYHQVPVGRISKISSVASCHIDLASLHVQIPLRVVPDDQVVLGGITIGSHTGLSIRQVVAGSLLNTLPNEMILHVDVLGAAVQHKVLT